jgi:hypothetical protein
MAGDRRARLDQLRGSTIGLLTTLLIVSAMNTTAQAARCDARTNPCPADFKVPSALYPTIQSAIDAIPDQGTVRLSAGLYVESLQIEAKQVDLIGPDPEEGIATIVGANPEVGAITFGGGGGGLLKGLSIEGGAYGVMADGAVLPSPVQIADTSISDTGRGVFGSFSDLTIKDAKISDTSWNGISVTGAKKVQMQDTYVTSALGCGLYLNGTTNVSVVDVYAFFNHSGGICISDSHLVEIQGSHVGLNARAGIDIRSSSFVVVDGTEVGPTLAQLSDGNFGDGIDVWQSDYVGVFNSRVSDSDRAGIANLGSSLALRNTEICCAAFELEGEDYLGRDYSFENLGGNVCGCPSAVPPEPLGDCTVASVNIEPPEPIGG